MKESSAYEWILTNLRTFDEADGSTRKPFPIEGMPKIMAEAIQLNPFILIKKPRQMMATWTLAAMALYYATSYSRERRSIVFVVNNSGDAEYVMNRVLHLLQSGSIPGLEYASVAPSVKSRRTILMSNGNLVVIQPSRGVSNPLAHDHHNCFVRKPEMVFIDEMAFYGGVGIAGQAEQQRLWGLVMRGVGKKTISRVVVVSSVCRSDDSFSFLLNNPPDGFSVLDLSRGSNESI